jgi:hypothetical protein
MSINCEVILRWNSMPEQHRALGAALWRWCSRAAGTAGMYPYLDNQALADLIAGRLPTSDPVAWDAGLPHVHLSVPGDPARDREAMLESLRRAIPSEGVAEVRVDGMSGRLTEAKDRTIEADLKERERWRWLGNGGH